jgi:hypothetical protein
VRSIPHIFRAEAVNWFWKNLMFPYLGFGDVQHRNYTNIHNLSTDTAAFLVWVKNARFVVASDSAAVHIAARFNVPAMAFFNTISSELRMRDYSSLI